MRSNCRRFKLLPQDVELCDCCSKKKEALVYIYLDIQVLCFWKHLVAFRRPVQIRPNYFVLVESLQTDHEKQISQSDLNRHDLGLQPNTTSREMGISFAKCKHTHVLITNPMELSPSEANSCLVVQEISNIL
jgi:hypothetical protein